MKWGVINIKINVLGTEYTITFKNDAEVCADMGICVGECFGYCSSPAKSIVIANLDTMIDPEPDKEVQKKVNLRHEIVHAFLDESGLETNANEVPCWAQNEEMVDWFAIQGPKIYKAWKEAGAL